MARKKTRYQWTSEEGEVYEPVERRDRNELRAHNQALEELALRLASMTSGQRQRLPLDPFVLEEIDLLARLGPKSARRRQLLRVQAHLRAADLEVLEAALAGAGQDDAMLNALERWRGKLLEGGDDALNAFMDAHPAADRQRIRALIRQAKKPGPSGKKAKRSLFQVLKAASGGGAEGEE